MEITSRFSVFIILLSVALASCLSNPGIGGYGLNLPFNLVLLTIGAPVFLSIMGLDILRAGTFGVTPAIRFAGFLLLSTVVVAVLQIVLSMQVYAGVRLAALAFLMVTIYSWRCLLRDFHCKGVSPKFQQQDLPTLLLISIAALSTLSGPINVIVGIIVDGRSVSLTTLDRFGAFLQPNVMGVMVAVGLAASLFYGHRFWTRRPLYLFTILCCFLWGFSVVYLQSRITYLIVILLLLLLLLDRDIDSRHLPLRRVILLAFVGGIVLGLITILSVDELRRGDELLADTSGNSRLPAWYITGTMIFDHPFTGSGLGNFRNEFLLGQAEIYKSEGVYAFSNFTHPHNEPLLWMVEGGLIYGFLALLALAWLLFRWRKLRPYTFGEYALLLVIFIPSLTEYPLHFSILHFWVLALIIAQLDFVRGTEVRCNADHPKIFSGFMWSTAFVVFVFFGSSFYSLRQIVISLEEKLTIEQSLERWHGVLNPILYNEFIENNIHTNLLKLGAVTDRPIFAFDYAGWAQNSVGEYQYNWSRIYHLAVAKAMLGDSDGSKATIDFLHYLYPPEKVPEGEVVVSLPADKR